MTKLAGFFLNFWTHPFLWVAEDECECWVKFDIHDAHEVSVHNRDRFTGHVRIPHPDAMISTSGHQRVQRLTVVKTLDTLKYLFRYCICVEAPKPDLNSESSRGGRRLLRLNFFIFTQFSGKNWSNSSLVPPLGVGTPYGKSWMRHYYIKLISTQRHLSDLAEAEHVGLVFASDGVHDDERSPGIEAARHDAVVVGHVADPLDALPVDLPLLPVHHEPTMVNQLLKQENVFAVKILDLPLQNFKRRASSWDQCT